MKEFNTLEAISNLFEKVNCKGNENNYFISYVTAPTSAGLLGGAVGSFAAGAIVGAENKCDAYLVNQTENGIGLIPLNSSGIPGLSMSGPDKMTINIDGYYFINKQDIKKLTVKRANLISLVSKSVNIELTSGRKYYWLVNNKEKLLPYHEQCFKNFAENIRNNLFNI